MSRSKKQAVVTNIRPADENHQVVTVEGSDGNYRRQPCGTCPWRTDAVGEFPAEAFRHSADTAYDMAREMFGCHESGSKKPATCAGFLLRGSAHNLSVRLGYIQGHYKSDITDGGHQLHASYRTMAVANGVDANDPVLQACRS